MHIFNKKKKSFYKKIIIKNIEKHVEKNICKNIMREYITNSKNKYFSLAFSFYILK